MKVLMPLVLAVFAALPAMAGLAYRFESTSSGLAATKIAGTVQAEGRDMRIVLSSGDGTMFKTGAVALTRDGGGTVTVLDPSAKTYYVLALADIAGGGALLESLRQAVDFRIENEKSGVRDAGDGGKVEGFPTRRALVDVAYDIVIDAMGQKMRMQMASTTETWFTTAIGAEYTNFFQQRAFKTGIDALDKVLAAQAAAVKGFPLKQVATVRVRQNGQEITNVTTTTVTGVQRKAFPVTVFAMPAGYRKVESPLEKAMR